MEIKEFIEKFSEAIELESVDELTAETEFKLLDEWTSLSSLSIIAMVDEEYDVEINGQDLRSCETIEDLFNLVNSKK
jgi:acyl carrier protein